MASNSYGVPPGGRRLDELALKSMQLLGATQLMAELNLQAVPNTFARNICTGVHSDGYCALEALVFHRKVILHLCTNSLSGSRCI